MWLVHLLSFLLLFVLIPLAVTAKLGVPLWT